MDHPLQNYRLTQNPVMSRAELARRLEVARITITRWETREQKPDEKLLKRIEEVTGIPAKELRPDLIEKHEEIFGVAQ
jgi:transcriptional regulator with XRE-family HTH domain